MVKAAAIKQDGKVYYLPQPARHHHIISYISKYIPGFRDSSGKILRPVNGEQGFVDEKDNFLTRAEAGIEGIKCGQAKELKFSSKDAFSEDFW